MDKIGLRAAIHCLLFQRELTYYDIWNIIRCLLNEGPNGIRAFLYVDGGQDNYGPDRMITPYKFYDGKYDLSQWNTEYTDRLEWFAEICDMERCYLIFDVLDNCSFGYQPNEPFQPWTLNHQNIFIDKHRIYGRDPAALTLIKDLFEHVWVFLRNYRHEMMKIGTCNEASWNHHLDWSYNKYEEQAKFTRWIKDEVLIPLGIPEICWRSNPMTTAKDLQRQYIQGLPGENGWAWDARAWDPYPWGPSDEDHPAVRSEAEIEMHMCGQPELSPDILPQAWIDTVFNAAIKPQMVSMSDDGVHIEGGTGESEGGDWTAETPEEFAAIFRRMLYANIRTGVFSKLEHLLRECNKKQQSNFKSMKDVREYLGEKALSYFSQANKAYRDITGKDMEHYGKHSEFMVPPECKPGQIGERIKELCWDGSEIVVRQQECVNGHWEWRDTGAACPPKPEPESCWKKHIAGRPPWKWNIKALIRCLFS